MSIHEQFALWLEVIYSINRNCKIILKWLRSAVGEQRKCSTGGETAGTEPERNAAAEPKTEAAAVAANTIAARDERAGLRRGTGVVERVTGRRAAREVQQNRALVTTGFLGLGIICPKLLSEAHASLIKITTLAK